MNNIPAFTAEMKNNYTILMPTMLPMHFKMMESIFRSYGYKAELLENSGNSVKECGLKHVHNDTCYPALLVIGQLIEAVGSGKYDPDKVALLISQTGGGCRASNYISLLRKALQKAGYGQIPVISFNIAGLESQPGFKVSLAMLHRLLYAVLYGDLLMLLRNQCRPYEICTGEAQSLADRWTKKLTDEMAHSRISYFRVKKNYSSILNDFAQIPLQRKKKIKVGIVGEIFVKFSPLGNNNLEDFLFHEGAEVVMPGLFDFCLYCTYNNIMDTKLYGTHRLRSIGAKYIFNSLVRKQSDLISIIKRQGIFAGPTPFIHTVSLTRGYIGIGAKMGEGWLLTAEMLELIDEGVENIICTQPFGCLPNHIVGKGMMKPIKERHPNANIVAVDYDPSATRINQENRIKLMLANAKTSSDAYITA